MTEIVNNIVNKPMADSISIDLETLDTQPTSAIIAIGFAVFNIATGIIHKYGEFIIDMEDDVGQDGRTASLSTIKFWMKQTDDARKRITDDDQPIRLIDALNRLENIINDYPGLTVWGNGATFDISILEHAYDYETPWKFWNARDVRTIYDAAMRIKSFDKKSIVFEGEAHTAKDDAVHQAKIISHSYRALAGTL